MQWQKNGRQRKIQNKPNQRQKYPASHSKDNEPSLTFILVLKQHRSKAVGLFGGLIIISIAISHLPDFPLPTPGIRQAAHVYGLVMGSYGVYLASDKTLCLHGFTSIIFGGGNDWTHYNPVWIAMANGFDFLCRHLPAFVLVHAWQRVLLGYFFQVKRTRLMKARKKRTLIKYNHSVKYRVVLIL